MDHFETLHTCCGHIENLHMGFSRRGTYVTITSSQRSISYVLNENRLGPGEKIKCFSGLKGPIFILQSTAYPH